MLGITAFFLALQASPPPLVRFEQAPAQSSAPRWTFKNWTTSDLGNFTLAGTENESGSAFGAICGSDCVFFVNMQTDCDKGKNYLAMINSPAGSYAITLRCYHLDKLRLLTFSMDKSSIGIFDKTGEVGFAIPLASGRFGVSRFSLLGGEEAVAKAISLAVAKRKSNQQGLRDFTI